jgi:RecB family endonuclease NucS
LSVAAADSISRRLDRWIAADVSVLRPGLMVVGQQVPTESGGIIDLLCVKEGGDLVVLELKRDKTPRQITAQVLNYASWAKELRRPTSRRSPLNRPCHPPS